jgi:hypothetical protein
MICGISAEFWKGCRSARKLPTLWTTALLLALATVTGVPPLRAQDVIYDPHQNLFWLADANLAGNEQIRKMVTAQNPGIDLSGIDASGTMDYQTALNWVEALNHLDHGRGFLGHNDWQLPVTPQFDSTCSSFNQNNFGPSCTGSALGNLYNVSLRRSFPDSVDPHFANVVWPFRNLQPSLYWTSLVDPLGGGQETFSFLTALPGGPPGTEFTNTTKFNYFHVLPVVYGPIDTPPTGSGVVPYTHGPAAGLAVHDTNTGYSWVLDANLAAGERFDLKGTTSIPPDCSPPTCNGITYNPPLIDASGTMLLETADPKNANGWLAALNQSKFAGSSQWDLPTREDLQNLFDDVVSAKQIQPADQRLVADGRSGWFCHLQPFFYWACQRDQKGDSQSPCNPNLSPGQGMGWAFDFADGFQGTDELIKHFYVMVYYPAHCATPAECCGQDWDSWHGGRCE